MNTVKKNYKPVLETLNEKPAWWRAKIGSIMPSVDLVSCQELQTIFPPGVMLLQTRVMIRETTPDALIKLGDAVLYAAELLSTAKPDVISYSCTSSAIMKGAEYEANIIKKMEEVSGAKCTSMALSIREALNFLNVKKIALVTPYIQEIVDAEGKYLESFGFDIIYSETLGIVDPLITMARTPRENFNFTFNAAQHAPEAEVIVISCGAMRSIEAIEDLEREIGKPVVSSNICTAWSCLKLANIKEPIHGYGSLLAKQR